MKFSILNWFFKLSVCFRLFGFRARIVEESWRLARLDDFGSGEQEQRTEKTTFSSRRKKEKKVTVKELTLFPILLSNSVFVFCLAPRIDRCWCVTFVWRSCSCTPLSAAASSPSCRSSAKCVCSCFVTKIGVWLCFLFVLFVLFWMLYSLSLFTNKNNDLTNVCWCWYSSLGIVCMSAQQGVPTA